MTVIWFILSFAICLFVGCFFHFIAAMMAELEAFDFEGYDAPSWIFGILYYIIVITLSILICSGQITS